LADNMKTAKGFLCLLGIFSALWAIIMWIGHPKTPNKVRG